MDPIALAELLKTGNLRQECEQLMMFQRGNSFATVEFRGMCYIKHTEVERGHRYNLAHRVCTFPQQ